MRENADKKNMPMAAPDEMRLEAPGLRVGATAWKWPPVWPYDSNFFKRQSEMDADAERRKRNGGAAGLLGGMGVMGGDKKAEVGAVVDDEDGGEGAAFDSLKYWSGKSDVRTDLDERVAERIAK
jgi:hypothetical protein